MSSWQEYKKKHGIVVQQKDEEEAKQQEPEKQESAWERYKRVNGTPDSNPNLRKQMYERQETWNNLQSRRQELENAAPTATGNRDAEWADYYRRMLSYANDTGDSKFYWDNYKQYQNAEKKVEGQYDSHAARHAEADARMGNFLSRQSGYSGAKNNLEAQTRKKDRDQGFYGQMASDAARIGSQKLYDKAYTGFGDSYAKWLSAIDNAEAEELKHLEANAPDVYIARTTSDEDVDAKIAELTKQKNALQSERDAAFDEYRSLQEKGKVAYVDSHGVGHYGPVEDQMSAAADKLQAVEKELAKYTEAARLQKKRRGEETYNQYLGGGKILPPEIMRNVETGKARYQADRNAAIEKGAETLDYGLNFFAKARGVWRGDKDKLEEAGWDSTFDTAANLTSEDENLFYALYADDPQKAMEFATYANNRRNEEYEQYMAEWAGESGVNAAAAFFQALGNRIGSGAVNLVDPNSAEANQLAHTSSGLLSGGSQLLNEWSGTIDTDIPIVRDLFNGKGLGDFYQLANSILESQINAYAAGKLGEFIPGGGGKGIGALGVMLMGSSASAADYNESIKRGLTPGEAQKHALAAGINEALFEFVSLDKLIDTEKLLQAGTIGKKIKAIFIQSGVEASEEFCTTVANRLADAAQARRDGYDSQIENRAKELIALGMSRDEALEKAEKEWLTELINDAIGGFISGGAHDMAALAVTAPARAVSYVRGERAANQAAGATSTNEQQAAMRAYAEANGIEWRTAENAAQAVKQAETATQNAENAEQQAQSKEQPKTRQEKRQERREEKAQAKSEREIGADVRRVQEHIDKQFAGKSVQEQTAIRDKLVQQYGETIEPAVYSAVRTNAYQQAAQNANPTAIQAAKEAALEGVTDQDMRRAVSSAYDQAAVELAVKTKNTDALGRYYQQIRSTGTGNMTMEAIVKGKDGQETRSAITGMSEDGKSVTLADGSTVAVKDLQADADTLDIIHEISDLGLGKNTDKVFQAYKKSGKTGLDGYRWIMDYTTAIDQGRNRRISLQEAIKRSSLDAETVMEAYEMGHKETMDETRKAVQKNENRPKRKGVTGHVANIDTSAIQNEPMSKQEREQFDLANQIFELLGVDVKWESSKTKNGKYVGANGSYLNGAVTLDIHAGRNDAIRDINSGILATTGHELTHFLQEYAPEQYQALKEFVLQQIVKNGKYGEATLERMIQDKQNRSSKKLTKSQAEDEVVADACQTMLRDSKALREFAEQKPEAAKGIIQWLADWFKKIKAAFSRSAQLSEQARIMEKLEKDVREAFGKLWDDALREAVRVHDEIGNMESAAARDIEETGASAQMAEEAIVQNSDRIDAETQRFLDNQDHVTVYRAMQLIDGKLYPPMAAKVDGKLVEPTEIGKWYQSVERPDLVKNGKFTLNKGNGSSIAAAYNPYFHCSASPLNDQFSSAYKRPNLVVVEGIIPSSELTSGYKAEGAKNAVGETTWHAGPVASKLKGDKARRVFLSRYFQVSRIMTDGEVADIIAKTLQGENVKIPSNVVTPGLLEALQERGVAIENKAQNSDRDTEYLELAKDPEKNAARLQEMVDEAAKEAGYTHKGFHQTGADFTSFNTDNEVAGQFDDETPTGIFIKPTDEDIGLTSGTKQMPLYFKADNMLEFANREEIRDYWKKNVPGYRELDAQLQARDNELKRQYDELDAEWFRVYEETYGSDDQSALDALDKRQDEFLEEWNKALQPLRRQMKNLVTAYMKESKYDGIHLKYDGKVYGGPKVETYIVFDPEQVKSAEPVTYDDQGNVIPLSERFNPEQEDIRYSERDYDSTGRELSEGQQEYFKDSKAVDQNGNLLVLYHGGPGMTVFRGRESTTYSKNAIYMTDEKEVARAYAGTRGITHELYANITNPLVLDAQGRNYTDIPLPKNAPQSLLDEFWYDGTADLDNLPVYAEENGYDGVIVYNVREGVGGEPMTEVVAFRSNQIKRTDNLNPTKNPDIRYSERDYDTPSDLDLLLNAAEEISEGGGEEYWASLLKEEPGLANETEEIKRLGKQLRKTEADLAEAQRNLKLTDRKLKTRGIASLAATIMQDQKAGDINKKDVKNRITAVLTDAYQKALDQLDAGASISEAWETVYRDGVVNAADILLTDATYAEKHGYGWVKTTLGKYLGEGGREYVEADIASRVAQDFDANRYRPGQKGTVADRLVAQAENRVNKKLDAAKTENAALKAENLKLAEAKDFYKEQADTAKATAGELYQQLLDKREELKNNKKISADERKATLKKLDNMTRQMQAKRQEAQAWKEKAKGEARKVNQAIREKEAAVSKLEKQLQREKDILSGKLKPPAMQKLLKAVREHAYKAGVEHKEEVFKRYKERQEITKLRTRIKNLSNEMKRRMTNPSERVYVPASLYESMARLADVLDEALSPKPGTTAEAKYKAMMEAIHRMSKEYEAVQKLDDPVYSSEYEKETQDAIDKIEELFERKDATWISELTGDTTKTFKELDFGELRQLYELMQQINYAMVNASVLLRHSEFKSVYAAMDAVSKQQREIKPLNEIGKHEAGKRERILNKLSTMRAVEMMSGWNRESALYQLMRGIEQGTMDANAWVMFYDKTMQPLKNGKDELEYRQSVSKKMDYGATDERGNKVLMTKMQALQILMTAEREAHNDKLVHLQRGGAVIRDLKAKRNYRINVTPDLLQKIQNSLTEWDKSYMKTVRDYFQREGKRTNEILYKMRHKVLPTEDYYTPYYVDKDYLETKLDQPEVAMQMWNKTPRSINALTENASQPVYIDGMDTVMNQHVKEISNYIGLALAIRDFAKVYNGMIRQGDGEKPLPVKQTINDNFESGSKLLTQAVIDVQGGRKPKEHRTRLGKMLEKLQSAFYRKSLLINMGVTIKQAASYVAAESILDHRAIIAGNRPVFVGADKSHSPSLIAHLFMTPSGKTAQRIFNEIDEHTPLHWLRRQGMSMQELAEASAKDGAIKNKLGMLGARMEQSKIGHAARMVTESLDPLNWIQRMDVATTAALWVACKEQATLDGMKAGTAEYWNHVTELYERVITETQPMYDTLHRSEDQKDRNGLMQYLFPFRTVPIQNHGQLVASYETMLAARKSGDKARIEAATRFARKTAVAQAMSAAIFATFTLFAQAMKRKTKKYRDEDEELTLGSLGLGVSKDVVGTLFSVFFPMYGSMVWDSVNTGIDYAKTGKNAFSYNSFSIGVVDMLNDIQKNGSDLAKDMIDLFAGREVDKDKTISHIGKLLTSGLECFGWPTKTAESYWNGIKGNVEDLANGRIPALNDETWERATSVNANRFYKAWGAGDAEKMQTVLDEVKASGKSEESISSAFNARAKEAYEAGEISLEEYADYLEKTGMFDDEKISGKIKTILRDEYTAGARGEDETIDALITYCGMYEDKAWETVQKWEGKAEHAEEEDYNWSKYDDLRAAIDANKDISGIVAELTEHGTKESDIQDEAKKYLKKLFIEGKIPEDKYKNQLSRYCGIRGEDANKIVNDAKCKKATGYAPDDLDDAYRDGEISKTDAKNALTRYGGLTGTDADKKLRWWDQQKAHPDMEITEGACNSWYDGTTKTRENGRESAKAAGMSLEAYLNAKAKLDKISDANDNGTGEDEYIAALAKMNLTPRQKDALYYEKYKGGSRKGIYKTW